MNIVTSYDINQKMKQSKYYKINLGFSSTLTTTSGNKSYNQSDEFAFKYNNLYKTTIYSQGSIGDIRFYTDHYIKDKKIAVYYNDDEFIFDFNENDLKEIGVDSYLGSILRKTKEESEKRKEEENSEKRMKEEIKINANPDKLKLSPGSVTYEDIKAYMRQKNNL